MFGSLLLRYIGKALYPIGRDGRSEAGPVTLAERRKALLVVLAILLGGLVLILGVPLAISALLS